MTTMDENGLFVFSFPAASIARGRVAADSLACVAAALRELLPVPSMTTYRRATCGGLAAATARAPDARACDALERARKEQTRRLRASGHFGRAAGCLRSGVEVFENDDPSSDYSRLFVRGRRPVAQQYLGVLIALLESAAQTHLAQRWSELLGPEFDGRIRNINYCPPSGFIPWHTNRYDAEGWRLYLIDAPPSGDSRFSISNGAEVRHVGDRTGWFNLFRITSGRPLWHCVSSDTHRVSCGVRVNDRIAAGLLAQASAAGALEMHEVPCST